MRVFNFFRRLFTPLPIFFQRLFCIYKYFSSDFSAGRTYFSNDFCSCTVFFTERPGTAVGFCRGVCGGGGGKAAPSPALPAGAALLWGEYYFISFFLSCSLVSSHSSFPLFSSSLLSSSLRHFVRRKRHFVQRKPKGRGELSTSDNLRGMKRPRRMG